MPSLDAVSRLNAAYKQVTDPTIDTKSPNKLYKPEWPQLKAALEQNKDFDAAAEARLKAILAQQGVSAGAKKAALAWLASEADKFRPTNTPTPGAVIAIEAKGPWAVFLNDKGEFTTDAAGKSPASLADLGNALARAGFWLQDNFDAKTTLFGKFNATAELRDKTFTALDKALARDLSSLNGDQKRQYVGAAGALLVDLLKSTPNQGLGAALHGKIFDAIHKLIADKSTSGSTADILTARMQDKQVTGSLSAAQKAVNDKALERIAPPSPLDYTEKARQAARDGKVTLNIDHASGDGEGFMEGYSLALEAKGFKRQDGATGNYHSKPGVYVKTVKANDPANKWGVDFEVSINLRPMRDDMYKGMGDPKVDWVSYGGHSNLGRNKLNSLKNAPDAKGFKLIMTDLCCGSDGMDAEHEKYPGVANLSSHCSTYFRTRNDPRYGKISYESEGFDMMMTMIDGAAGKKGFEAIEKDLKSNANWWGHPTSNNWITPNAWRRRFKELDIDNDGASDLVDAMPSYNTFDIAADTRGEFDLKSPSGAASKINGRRAFQASRALNTFGNYNPALEPFINQRDVVGAPGGIFFDAKPGDKEYVRFSDVTLPTGEKVIGVAFSAALADMSTESLRAVLFYEYVQHLVRAGKLRYSPEEAVLMGLVNVAGALEFDNDWRDQEIFDNLKRIYGIPAGVGYRDVASALSEAESRRHNYSGDKQAVDKLLTQYRQSGVVNELKKPGVGSPSVAVA